MALIAVQEGDEDSFDVAWPEYEDDFLHLGREVASRLAERDWCSIQIPRSSSQREKAVARASKFPFQRQKTELVPDFLGHQGYGKMAAFDPLKLTTLEEVERKLSMGTPADPIKQLDQDLSVLFATLAPTLGEVLGMEVEGRTDAMVWLPFSGGRERASLGPEDLEDDDVEAGVIEKHLQFLRRRKVCFVYLAKTDGSSDGDFKLLRRDPSSGQISTVVAGKAVEGRVYAFRCDRLGYQYRPEGQHLTLVSWILEESPRLELASLQGDEKMKDEFYGLFRGPGAPYHECSRILGISCYTGGGCVDLESAINLYASGTDAGIYVPYNRFDTDIYFTQKGMDDFQSSLNSYHYHGGLCADEFVMGFDNDAFGISTDEASILHPNQRKVLEVGYMALHHAGHNKSTVQGKPIIVGVGDSGTEWHNMLFSSRYSRQVGETPLIGTMEHPERLDWSTAGATSAVGTRISYQLGLIGPCFTVDTACSSGLSAFNTTVFMLRSPDMGGQLNMSYSGALAGGVNQIMDPFLYIGCCAQHMVSVRGRCFTFDSSGDGYGKGEGVGMLYSERGDGSYIERQLGAAIGSRLNQDGRSASMTAPNGPAQQACIKASLREAGIRPRDITTQECHGTGTALGDPIEIGSLRGVQETDTRDDPTVCTSAKSNLGHQEPNAGTIGLIKCVLMGKYGMSPPNVHLRCMNPHLDTTGWPVWFQNEIVDVGVNSGIAGVSSFGVSGTNAHCEVWARALHGPNNSMRLMRPALEMLDQVIVTCPITFAPIDYLTGEPAPAQGRTGPHGEKVRVRADVLREEMASYDVSSYAYNGGYRYRREALDETFGLLEESAVPHICGSWSGWQEMEEMVAQEDGAYSFVFRLGETRAESFFVTLNGDTSMRLYPGSLGVCDRSDVWVEGPNEGGEGARWLVDGLREEYPSGSAIKVLFWWGPVRKKVEWERVGFSLAPKSLPYRHSYALIASWTSGLATALREADGEGGKAWETNFRLGPSGRETFSILRDFDQLQAIYPAGPLDPTRLCGPDHLGDGKHFVVTGRSDERKHIRLEVVDGLVELTVSSDFSRPEIWRSCPSGKAELMVMDEDHPGVFRP